MATQKQGEEPEDSVLDALVEQFSDYYEGNLDDEKRKSIEALIAGDEKYRQAYADFEKTMELLSGMRKMIAPDNFEKKVENTIRRRSGGRFFGRRAFGERVPYELLAVVVMVVASAVYWMGRSSVTGAHRPHAAPPPAVHEGAREVMPKL